MVTNDDLEDYIKVLEVKCVSRADKIKELESKVKELESKSHTLYCIYAIAELGEEPKKFMEYILELSKEECTQPKDKQP